MYPAAVISNPARRSVADLGRRSVDAGAGCHFVMAVVLAAVAFGAFLVVSDSDDDGNLDVDVPAIDVDITTG